ncbi:hypothetical protein VF04_03835 [Nostoc linckia z7]|uniref:Uncharacterized protein n=2 Tax=Nostoc linckia TaxID=92942 RepID=A0A9Q5ZGK8_NOSLI|nr:hypothetical protein [Nostoc linckia]PHK42988.1 hypothetical protein VF12_01300 [Nostoc linckia z15]PHK48145.1 hypothetical protein VF13_02275 [Nostoc linckia z16]PHJ64929.1 hypothetical protein VF02_11325 [Nostoc linckia z1]PHJ70106.1 hypothetical protein VF05_11480 [Nostoc linckia z3]PHJ75007.1 hypothetical protein VF03_11640 [Nostoc linckia z2]
MTASTEQISGEAIGKLAELVQKLIQAKNVAEEERDAAKEEAAQILGLESTNLEKINQLIDVAAAALPDVTALA